MWGARLLIKVGAKLIRVTCVSNERAVRPFADDELRVLFYFLIVRPYATSLDVAGLDKASSVEHRQQIAFINIARVPLSDMVVSSDFITLCNTLSAPQRKAGRRCQPRVHKVDEEALLSCNKAQYIFGPDTHLVSSKVDDFFSLATLVDAIVATVFAAVELKQHDKFLVDQNLRLVERIEILLGNNKVIALIASVMISDAICTYAEAW